MKTKSRLGKPVYKKLWPSIEKSNLDPMDKKVYYSVYNSVWNSVREPINDLTRWVIGL